MEMLFAAVKMLFAMGIGLTLLYLLVRFTKGLERARRGPAAEGGVRVLASKPIAPQKYISLVEIGGEVLALGISAQQVTFLTKIDNPEKVRESLEAAAEKNESFPRLPFWPPRNKRIKPAPLGFGHEK
jgi:flagellar biogenesis protein FliO